jgi:4-hydroxy-3-methylbut-2-en-1-yl diphosphate synthase IspG/GcpE
MQVVRVESLEKLETQGTQMRLSTNAGSLSGVFAQEVRETCSPTAGGMFTILQPGDSFCRS